MGIIFENPSFETGNFSSWDIIGNTSVETADFGVTPTEGTQQAVVSSDIGAVSDAELETFLGLEAATLDNLGNGEATEGSAIQQTVTVEAGDLLTFDWNFLTNEGTPSSFNDFSFVSLTPDSTSELADTNDTFVLSDTPLNEETGFQTFTYEFQSSGTFTVGAGVVDVSDNIVASALVLDNFITINVENGTEEDDIITGTKNRDQISGQGGNDLIKGRNGDDLLNGDAGNDRILGNSGNDSLQGGSGNDELIGNSGNDNLVGNTGDDRLTGGAGDDSLDGGQGNDVLRGNGGADTFIFGSDLLDGVADIDTIDGYQSADVFDFSGYLDAGGSIGVTRVSAGQIQIELDGEDTINVFGRSRDLDTAESQLG